MKGAIFSLVSLIAAFGIATPIKENEQTPPPREGEQASPPVQHLEPSNYEDYMKAHKAPKQSIKHPWSLTLEVKHSNGQTTLDHAYALKGTIMPAIASDGDNMYPTEYRAFKWTGVGDGVPGFADKARCVAVMAPWSNNPLNVMRHATDDFYKIITGQVPRTQYGFVYNEILGESKVLMPEASVSFYNTRITPDKYVVNGYLCFWPDDNNKIRPFMNHEEFYGESEQDIASDPQRPAGVPQNPQLPSEQGQPAQQRQHSNRPPQPVQPGQASQSNRIPQPPPPPHTQQGSEGFPEFVMPAGSQPQNPDLN